jgi:hypothetical protein
MPSPKMPSSELAVSISPANGEADASILPNITSQAPPQASEKTVNGLAEYLEVPRTPEEAKVERRFIRRLT